VSGRTDRMSVARGSVDPVETILIPPLLCSSRVYGPVLDTVWSHGSVTIADTLHDDTLAGMAGRLLAGAPERFALLGTSMGGYVALEVMRQAPQRVAALALVSTSARADSPEQLSARRRQSQLVEEGRFDGLVDAAFRGVVAERNESDPELLRVWRGMAATVGPQGFLRQQAAVMARADSRDLLAGVACPTVVIHGAEDRLIPVTAGAELAAGIPGASLHLIEEAGHFLLLERPDAAAAAVDEFLAAAGC
jgi:pimeloyl-ACP methyl ester carboxylesterase